MTEINKAGDNHSLGHIDIPQGKLREQMDVVSDSLRQLGGKSEIQRGNVVNDPLNAPFVLYVNPYTGKDTYVSGDYSTPSSTQDERLRRISQQRLVCGYTAAQPFKTIERAAIEAAIITAYSYWTNTDTEKQQVCINVAPGEYIAQNGSGEKEADIESWCAGLEPDADELKAFNPSIRGGIILPRGCSLVSLDLRKTIIRPAYVPQPADEDEDYGNRRTIFRMTGQGYYYGFTFKDKQDSTTSHHLLSTFEFASKAELDEYYAKIVKAVGSCSGVSSAQLVTRKSEVEIVGPQPETPSEPTDTVDSASPYIYNTSIRSTLGLCGVFLDGAGTDGFRSCVMAQYTGVSLQKDLSSWQRYSGNSWGAVSSYSQYINASPNDLRFKPSRRSFHIRAVNNAVCQEVSVFAIGQAIHHWVETGGEITITNSNSNWGGCAAVAEGFHDKAAPTDKFHKIKEIVRPIDPTKNASIRVIKIGELVDTQSNTATTLEFKKDIDKSFEKLGYTISPGTYVWVVNPLGPDYRAKVDDPVYDGSDKIELENSMKAKSVDSDGNVTYPAPGSDDLLYADLAGQQVYIRRLVDTRTADERAYTILVDGDNNTRPPVRDYIPQIDGSNWTERVSTVLATAAVPERDEVTARVQFRYSRRPAAEYDHQDDVYYRPADTVLKDGSTTPQQKYSTARLIALTGTSLSFTWKMITALKVITKTLRRS